MFRNRVILILIFLVFVTTNVTYGQKNDNIRDIERSLNKSEGSEKLSKLNILTKHYKSTGDKQKLYKEILNKLLPETYTKTVKQHNLRPIISPKLTPLSIKEGENWYILFVFKKPSAARRLRTEKIR